MGRSKKPNLFRRFLSALGPGLITGAADDDPSGIATYTIAGAQLGTSLLWTAFVTAHGLRAVYVRADRHGDRTRTGHCASKKVVEELKR